MLRHSDSPLPNSLVSPREIATESKQIQAFSELNLRNMTHDGGYQTEKLIVMDSGDQTEQKQLKDNEGQTSQVKLVKESGDQTDGKADINELELKDSADQTSRPASQETIVNVDEAADADSEKHLAVASKPSLRGDHDSPRKCSGQASSLATKSDVQLDVDSDEKKAESDEKDSDKEFDFTPREVTSETPRRKHKGSKRPKSKEEPSKNAWADPTDSEYSASPTEDDKKRHKRRLLDPRAHSSISDETMNRVRHQTAKKFSRYNDTSPRSRARVESAFSQDNYQKIMEAYQPTEVRTNSAAMASYKPQLIRPTSRRMVKLWENNMWWKFKFKDDKAPNN